MIGAELIRTDVSPLKYRELDIPNWPDIDPATVVMALEDAAKDRGVELPQTVIDKVHAVQTILVNPVAFADPYAFEKTAEALNGLSPQFGYFPVQLPPAFIALAVQVMSRLRPNEEWGVAVKRYCREVLQEQGVVTMPASMASIKFDDPEMEHVTVNAEQRLIQYDYNADIEDYVKQNLA